MNKKVFLATPISGFATEEEYTAYRTVVLKLILFLRENGFDVCSELESISGTEDYSSPAKSVEDDFKSISKNDYFILLHPTIMQSSTLIEFGYACAHNKKILAVGQRKDFPYLVIGYEAYNNNARIVDIDELSEERFGIILDALKAL